MSIKHVDVLVLGAGVAGLTAAYYLNKRGVNTLVIEKQSSVGGRVQSIPFGNEKIDTGALFLTNSYNHTFELLRDLGIEKDVISINSHNGIVVKNKIYTLPPHSFFSILPLLPLSSWARLVPVMLDVMWNADQLTLGDILKGQALDTESVTEFSQKRLDHDLLKYIINPILRGIWYWNSDTTTKVALYLLLKQALTMQLFSLKDGMGMLTQSLSQSLNVLLETEAVKVRYEPESKTWHTTTQDSNGQHSIISKSVLCAIPASNICKIFDDLTDDIRRFFSGIQYTAISSAHFLLKAETLIPRFYGLYYPEPEPVTLAAVAVQTNKIATSVSHKDAVISVYASVEYSKKLTNKSNADIYSAILSNLNETYPFSQQNIVNQILQSKIIHITPALPVFDVGYIRSLQFFHDNLSQTLPPGIFFAGDYLGGPHIEGAVISAKNVLAGILNSINSP